MLQKKRAAVDGFFAATVLEDNANRAEVEQFIRLVFMRAYQADVTYFMPKLIALRNSENNLVAAFGVRPAIDGALFLEQYLDTPIELLLSKTLGKNISRSQITKIGNLAVANPRHAGLLIAQVIQYSLDIGIEWCVATTHRSLQNGLIKGGREVYPLFPADKTRLSLEEQAKWGSYYDRAPQVVAIRGIAQ